MWGGACRAVWAGHIDDYDDSNLHLFAFSTEVPLKDVLPLPLYLSEVTFCPVVGLKGPGITDGGKSRMDRMLHPQFVTDIDFSRDTAIKVRTGPFVSA